MLCFTPLSVCVVRGVCFSCCVSAHTLPLGLLQDVLSGYRDVPLCVLSGVVSSSFFSKFFHLLLTALSSECMVGFSSECLV